MTLLKRRFPSEQIQIDSEILLNNVKAGDQEAFDKMVLGHTGLAVSIVNGYIKRNRVIFLVDELDGAAFEGVVVAVDRIKKGHLSHDNFTGYIIYFIHEYIKKLLNKHFQVKLQQEEPLFPWLKSVSDNDLKLIDLWDQLSKISKTDFEKKVIELRSQNYTDREVAEKLNVPKMTVARTRHKLLKRFQNEHLARRI